MRSRRAFLKQTLGAAVLMSTAAACGTGARRSALSGGGASQASGAATSATAVTQVFGDGLKLTCVAVEYDKDIESSTLSPTSFTVAGRTVTKVYANTSPEPADQGRNGSYVILELSLDDADALLTVQGDTGGQKAPSSGAEPTSPPSDSGPAAPVGMNQIGPASGASGYATKQATASVTQAVTVTAVDGTNYAPTGTAIPTTRTSNLIVDDFKQFTYKEPQTGETLNYNLYIPKDYDKSKQYPLVLFMHDSGVTSTTTTATLTQGLGAVSWASPSDQAKRPAFVLAPQYPYTIVNDYSQATDLLDTTVDLVNDLTTRYSIDRNRLYTTGQSMGGMMSIAIDIKYPDLFTASFLVACQWDPALVSPMASDKLWIVVSQGDSKAYPGQNAITAALEKEGAKVSRAVWDGTSTAPQFHADVTTMASQGAAINYAALKQGTVVPPSQAGNPGGDHHNTWRIAYTIEGVREWIFRQQG